MTSYRKGNNKVVSREVPHIRAEDDDVLTKKYKFIREVGKGSFGIVSKVARLSTGEHFAIKEIVRSKAGTSGLKLIENEICILKKVQHPHIITLHEIIETNTNIYLVLDLCASELSSLVRADQFLSESDIRIIMKRTANAVAYLHKNGILHRDLKLENILLKANPEDENDRFYIQITDFGLSTIRKGGHDAMMHQTCGTIVYMAPELVKEQDYNEKVDSWALGVIMYKLMSGEFPHKPPSDERDQKDALKNVIKNLPTDHLTFNEPVWRKSSECAKMLIRSLMNIDTSVRLAAGEVLIHQFITGDKDCAGTRNVLEMMQQFQNEQHLERQANAITPDTTNDVMTRTNSEQYELDETIASQGSGSASKFNASHPQVSTTRSPQPRSAERGKTSAGSGGKFSQSARADTRIGATAGRNHSTATPGSTLAPPRTRTQSKRSPAPGAGSKKA